MPYRKTFFLSLIVLIITNTNHATAQPAKENYSEELAGTYTLPNPLIDSKGKVVATADDWTKRRRPEILAIFESQMFGKTPKESPRVRFKSSPKGEDALGGKAIRKQIQAIVGENGPVIHVLLYVPKNAKGKVPAFLGLNFGGNHTVHSDPGIELAQVWPRWAGPERSKDPMPTKPTVAAESTRGSGHGRWPVEMIIDRGYAVATAYYGDIEPDFQGGVQFGIRSVFPKSSAGWAADEWNAIGAWAWGLSRIADYLQSDPDIDGSRLALLGHSRLGKTALWAGAQDQRFKIVISNDSGEGGAAISRRNFGEDVRRLNEVFPHWFCKNYSQYNDRVSEMPFDSHMLIALIAPRPVYVASASEDLHADPRGEFLGALNAGPVYELLGKQGLGVKVMPDIHQPIMNTVGYHVREGKHDVTTYDWKQYLDFADKHFGRPASAKPSSADTAKK